MRALAWIGLTLALSVSLFFTLRAGAELASAPVVAVYSDASASGIEAAVNRALAASVTPKAPAARIAARLDEDPRD